MEEKRQTNEPRYYSYTQTYIHQKQNSGCEKQYICCCGLLPLTCHIHFIHNRNVFSVVTAKSKDVMR